MLEAEFVEHTVQGGQIPQFNLWKIKSFIGLVKFSTRFLQTKDVSHVTYPSSDHLEAAESLLAAPGLSLSDDDEESSRLRISSSYRTCSTRFVCWNKIK